MTRDEICEAVKNIREYCATHSCDNECPFYKSGWGGNCKIVGNSPLQWDVKEES